MLVAYPSLYYPISRLGLFFVPEAGGGGGGGGHSIPPLGTSRASELQ